MAPPKKIRGPELSQQIRSRICELHTIGYSYRRIHLIHPELSKSTIIRTCQLESKRINNNTKSRPGAPRKISEAERDLLYDTAIHQNPHISTKSLTQEVDQEVSERSIRRLMQEMDRRKWRQRKRAEIKQVHADKRLEWAKTYEHFTATDWH
jgi:transposase